MERTKIITATRFQLKLALKILAVAGVLFGLTYAFFAVANLELKKPLFINDKKINIEVAGTSEKIARGLSGRKKLGENDGLLFVYDGYFIPAFWMKGMEFSIDIIWIKDDMVVGVEKNVPLPSGSDWPTYRPQTFVNYVLEVNAGFVDKNGVKIGDAVNF